MVNKIGESDSQDIHSFNEFGFSQLILMVFQVKKGLMNRV